MKREIPKQLEEFSFLKSAPNSQKKLVLSIGSGDCCYEVLLQEKYRDEWDLFALEPALGNEKDKSWPTERTFHMYFESLPEKYQFDIILIFNLQLLSGHQEFFQKIHCQLKPGGQLLVGCHLIDPDRICSYLPIDQHIKNAFTLSDEQVSYPGWLSPGKQPNYQYMQHFYSAVKTLDKNPPITTPPLTAVEEQMNLDIAQWRKEFNDLAIQDNVETFIELHRVLEMHYGDVPENRQKLLPELSSQKHSASTSSIFNFFRQSVATPTAAAITGIAALSMMWMIWSSMNSSTADSNGEETDFKPLGPFSP